MFVVADVYSLGELLCFARYALDAQMESGYGRFVTARGIPDLVQFRVKFWNIGYGIYAIDENC